MVYIASEPNSSVDHTSVAVLNELIRIGPGSIFLFSAIRSIEYRNMIVPPVDAEITSRVIGCDIPIRRMLHPSATIPQTSQKYIRLSVTCDFGRYVVLRMSAARRLNAYA